MLILRDASRSYGARLWICRAPRGIPPGCPQTGRSRSSSPPTIGLFAWRAAGGRSRCDAWSRQLRTCWLIFFIASCMNRVTSTGDTAMRSATAWIPSTLDPPFFGISTAQTGPGKYDLEAMRFHSLERFPLRSASPSATHSRPGAWECHTTCLRVWFAHAEGSNQVSPRRLPGPWATPVPTSPELSSTR
jgi:hypothetical protein